MTKRTPVRRAVHIVMMVLVCTMVLGAFTVAVAARDRTPPTKPTNFRVTAKTAFSVALAWTPSTDNSGTFSYRL